MREFTSKMYQGLLASSELDIRLQRRILAFAKQEKDFDLIAKLCLHPKLDPEIDLEIKEIEAAVVKVAWLARPGRTLAELVEFTKDEKRGSVLSEVVSRADMPTELYEQVATNSRGQEALVSVVCNQAISDDIRKKALMRLANLLPKNSTSSKLDKYYQYFLTSYTELLQPVADQSFHLPLLKQVLNAGDVDHASQERIADLLAEVVKKEITKLKAKSNYIWHGEYKMSWVNEFSRAFISQYDLSKTAKDKMLSILTNLETEFTRKDQQNRATAFAQQLASLKAYKAKAGKPRISLVKAVQTATTVKQMQELLETANKTNTDNINDAALLAIIVSSVSTPDQAVMALEYIGYDGRETAVKLLRTPEKVAAYAINRPWAASDDLFASSTDPSLAFRLAVSNDEISSYTSRMLDSKYLTDDMLPGIPASTLLTDTTPGKISEKLIPVLLQELTTAEQWKTFEQMAPEFTGSFAELLEVVRSISH